MNLMNTSTAEVRRTKDKTALEAEINKFFSQFSVREDYSKDYGAEHDDLDSVGISGMLLGKCFPFVGREDALDQLKRFLLQLLRNKQDPFFLVIAAPWGLGKTTFVRRAFKTLLSQMQQRDKTELSEEEHKLFEFLNCVSSRKSIFRISLVGGRSFWEQNNPSLSLALRVLHDFLIHKSDDTSDRFDDFAKQCNPPAQLDLYHVLRWIGGEGFVIHIDDTSHVIKDSLRRIIELIHVESIESPFSIVCVLSGTDTKYLSRLASEKRKFPGRLLHLAPLSLPAMKSIVENLAEKSHAKFAWTDGLENLVNELGGNPVLLSILICNMTDRENLETAWTKEKFVHFLQSPMAEAIQIVRKRTMAVLSRGYTRKSLSNHHDSTLNEVRSHLYGFALSKAKVTRTTRLNKEWVIGDAEQTGMIYLTPVETTDERSGQQFLITIPSLYIKQPE